jgi:hypothetical protein
MDAIGRSDGDCSDRMMDGWVEPFVETFMSSVYFL